MSSSLYLYIDESGNFDFTDSGTNHFVLSALITLDPPKTLIGLQALRYRLLESGVGIEYFHTSEDSQKTRDEVFKVIQQTKDISLQLAYVKKQT